LTKVDWDIFILGVVCRCCLESFDMTILNEKKCLFVCLSLFESVCLFVCLQSECLIICRFVRLPVCMSVYLFVCVSVGLFVHLFVCLFVSLSVCWWPIWNFSWKLGLNDANWSTLNRRFDLWFLGSVSPSVWWSNLYLVNTTLPAKLLIIKWVWLFLYVHN
jgi:hypothetical protein